MKRHTKVLLGMAAFAIAVMMVGCYMFAPLEEKIESISVEPKYIQIKEGEQALFNVVVEPRTMQGQIDITYEVDKPELMEVYGGRHNGVLTSYVRGIGKMYVRARGTDKVAEALINIAPPVAGAGQYYITARNRIVTISQGQSFNLSAQLVGGSPAENEQMVWRVLDDRIAKLVGGGTQTLLQALQEGQTQVQVSHAKAETPFVIDIIVSGDQTQVYLNTTLLTMKVGDFKELFATVKNAPTPEVARNIQWRFVVPEGETAVGNIIGAENRVNIHATNVGTQKIMALAENGSRAYCEVMVTHGASLDMESTDTRLQPGEVEEIGYTLYPIGDTLAITNTNPGVATFTHDAVNKKLTITAGKEGSATIGIKSGSGVRQAIYVGVSWVRELSIDRPFIQDQPNKAISIGYEVSPPDSVVTAVSSDTTTAVATVDPVTKKIIVTGKKEGRATINLSTNYNATAQIIGDFFVGEWYPSIGWTNTQSPIKNIWGNRPDHGIRGNDIVIGDGGAGRVSVIVNPTGVGYTVSFNVSGTLKDMTYSIGGDGKSINFSFSESWTIIQGWRHVGQLEIVVTRTATGEQWTKVYNLYGHGW